MSRPHPSDMDQDTLERGITVTAMAHSYVAGNPNHPDYRKAKDYAVRTLALMAELAGRTEVIQVRRPKAQDALATHKN